MPGVQASDGWPVRSETTKEEAVCPTPAPYLALQGIETPATVLPSWVVHSRRDTVPRARGTSHLAEVRYRSLKEQQGALSCTQVPRSSLGKGKERARPAQAL